MIREAVAAWLGLMALILGTAGLYALGAWCLVPEHAETTRGLARVPWALLHGAIVAVAFMCASVVAAVVYVAAGGRDRTN